MAELRTNATLQWFRTRTHRISLANRTLVMGILNVTPDSFSDGGRFFDPLHAFDQAQAMIEAGADIIDVGAESSRPGAVPLPEQDEIQRLRPILTLLGQHLAVPLSVDTQKSAVARLALDLGVSIVNDISALRSDPFMGAVIAQAKAGVVLMHMQGTPATMQQCCTYGDVVEDVKKFLSDRVRVAQSFGIETDQIIIDPGIGFAKNTHQNLMLLKGLQFLNDIGCPVLVGPSNKSFIGEVLNKPVSERMIGTAAVVAASVLNGAKIVRVHDVRPMKDVVRMIDVIKCPGWVDEEEERTCGNFSELMG